MLICSSKFPGPLRRSTQWREQGVDLPRVRAGPGRRAPLGGGGSCARARPARRAALRVRRGAGWREGAAGARRGACALPVSRPGLSRYLCRPVFARETHASPACYDAGKCHFKNLKNN